MSSSYEVNEGWNTDHELYDAAMDGIPEACKKLVCPKAYAEALASAVAADSIAENRNPGDVHAVTPARVKREVGLRVGIYCTKVCQRVTQVNIAEAQAELSSMSI